MFGKWPRFYLKHPLYTHTVHTHTHTFWHKISRKATQLAFRYTENPPAFLCVQQSLTSFFFFFFTQVLGEGAFTR